MKRRQEQIVDREVPKWVDEKIKAMSEEERLELLENIKRGDKIVGLFDDKSKVFYRIVWSVYQFYNIHNFFKTIEHIFTNSSSA